MRFTAIVLSLFALTFAGCGEKDETDDSTAADDSSACTFTADCATFCAENVTTCAGTYTDAAACETVCAGFADGCDGDTSGDTLGCRTYHLGAAASDAATHCPHTAEDGGGVCVD